jgi:hypothetical protein
MLDDKSKSNTYHNMHCTPMMSHPYPIKSHVNKLSPESLRSLKKMIGRKLLKMHYAKQLEELYDLYDLVDEKDNEIKTEDLIKNSYATTENFTAFGSVLSLVSIIGYLTFRKLPVLHLESWIKEIYRISFIGFFNFTFFRFVAERINYMKYSAEESRQIILLTKHQIHATNVNIINSLRFNRDELI